MSADAPLSEQLLLSCEAECKHLRARAAELEAENARLHERLGPRGLEVVEISGSGHYVNEKVKLEIEGVRVRVAELEGVLKPFADLADHAERMGQQADNSVLYVMLGPCRRARAVLK